MYPKDRRVPKVRDAYGSLAEVLAFTAPGGCIGGIAFNSKGEFFYSDGRRGRLWKVVNGTSVLYVDKGSWPTIYGIAFDSTDNLYFRDWRSPRSIYYLDFRLGLTYRVLDGNKVPLNGATVSFRLPNGTKRLLTTNSTGHVTLARAMMEENSRKSHRTP